MAAANNSQELTSYPPKDRGTLPVVSTVPPQAKMSRTPEPSSSRLVEDEEEEVPLRRGIKGLVDKYNPTMVLKTRGALVSFPSSY